MSPPATPAARCRVLHLLWSGRMGGIERHVATLTRLARDRGAGDHRACFLDGRGRIGDPLVAEGLADRLELRGGWDPVGLLGLARLLRDRRPAVIHSHTHAVLPTLLALAVLPAAAWVYTEHSPRALGDDAKFRLLYGLLRRSGAWFIGPTPTTARLIAARGVPPARIVAVRYPLGVPPRPPGPEPDRPATLGIVARLEAQKRVDLVIEVVAELRRRGLPCRGLVVSEGSWRGRLMAQAGRLGLGEAVEFAGEQDDIVAWLDRMDVFLMTSAAEPFGLAALEAMARRVPVVAMPCPGGLGDLVSRGGLLLPDRTVETAAGAVGELLRSPRAREELRARGAATAAGHAPERVLPELERLYGALTSSPPAGRRA